MQSDVRTSPNFRIIIGRRISLGRVPSISGHRIWMVLRQVQVVAGVHAGPLEPKLAALAGIGIEPANHSSRMGESTFSRGTSRRKKTDGGQTRFFTARPKPVTQNHNTKCSNHRVSTVSWNFRSAKARPVRTRLVRNYPIGASVLKSHRWY
jgi:hypothetical protein